MAWPILRWRDIHGDHLGQILGQAAHLDLEQHVFEHAAVGLDALGFADGFDRHHDGDLLVLGDFVEIHMQHLAAERMVLDFLHQGQPLGPGIVLDRQVHQEVFGDGMVNQVFHFLGVDLEVLRLGLPAVNDGRNAAGGAQFFGPGAPAQRRGEMRSVIQISLSLNRFGGCAQRLTGAPAFKFKQRSHRRITMNSLDGFAQKPRHRQRGNLHAADRRAKDSISCNQFVNSRFSQSFDAHLVQNGVGNAGQNLLGPLAS